MPAVDRVLNYVHQRTLQRLTLDAIRERAPQRSDTVERSDVIERRLHHHTALHRAHG